MIIHGGTANELVTIGSYGSVKVKVKVVVDSAKILREWRSRSATSDFQGERWRGIARQISG